MKPSILTPSKGALVLLHCAVEDCVEREINFDHVDEIYCRLLEVVSDNDKRATNDPFHKPSIDRESLARLAELTGGPIPANCERVLVAHALRHARQLLAGSALTTCVADYGDLHTTKPWKHDAEADRFECSCVIFARGHPVSIDFIVIFRPMSLAIADTENRVNSQRRTAVV